MLELSRDMTLAVAIVSLLAALLPTILGLVVESLKKRATPKTPKERYEEEKQNIARTIAVGDERAANVTVDEFVNRLRNKSAEVRSDSSGQSGKES